MRRGGKWPQRSSQSHRVDHREPFAEEIGEGFEKLNVKAGSKNRSEEGNAELQLGPGDL